MSLAEAARLAVLLAKDPTTQLCAALNGWDYPASREFLVLADQFDAFGRVNSGKKKPAPYPRPWPDESKSTYGKGTAIPVDELRRTLDAHRAAVEAARTAAD